MAAKDWHALASKLLDRLRHLPRWAWIAGGSIVLAIVLFVALVSGGPAYSPLYDGLSAKQGGEVIQNLQKLGIPYSLNATGSIISVPAGDLARARLRLGKMGVPASRGGQAWQKLTKGSLTEGSAAISALSQRVLETGLEKGIDGISGVASSQVSLALPKSTPFLGDQPKPKASVWLHTTGAGVSRTQARAIAQMVANSVPGLSVARVTVTDQNGNVLAPLAGGGYDKEQRQLRFRGQVESTARARIEKLLVAVVGRENVRVSVSAAIDYDQTQAHKVQFGPNRVAAHVQQSSKQRVGRAGAATGVPGALSNEPPPDAAVVAGKTGTTSGAGGNAAVAAGQNSLAAAVTLPKSESSTSNILYDVDKTTTDLKSAPWHVKAMSVSVVLNSGVAGSNLTSKVKGIVENAISAPNLRVNVAAVPFHLQPVTHPGHHSLTAILLNSSLIRAVLALLATLFLYFAVARPVSRWIGRFGPRSGKMRSIPSMEAAQQGAGTTVSAGGRETMRQSVRTATEHPGEAAETLKRWLSERRDEKVPEQNRSEGSREPEA